jgi:hypothetical protein
MGDLHICTPEAPFFEAKHGAEAIHPSRTYQRDSTDVRGARRMAIYRCDICGTRFQDEPPEWAMVPIGVTPIPKPEPPKAELPKLKVGRITVTLPASLRAIEPVVETPPPIEAVFAPAIEMVPAEDPHGRDPEEGTSRPYPWEETEEVTDAEVEAPKPAAARRPKKAVRPDAV